VRPWTTKTEYGEEITILVGLERPYGNASSDEAGNPEVVAVLMRLQDMAKEMFAPISPLRSFGGLVVFVVVILLIPALLIIRKPPHSLTLLPRQSLGHASGGPAPDARMAL
jgi:hypothetical protein